MKDLETQLSSANHELELATFLNKGVLQTNTEYKLRIVELEAENGVLRKAESRLARTEDRLQEFEERVEAFEQERKGLEEQVVKEREERQRAEREKKELARRYWKLRGGLEGLVRDEEKGDEDGDKEGSSATIKNKAAAGVSNSKATTPTSATSKSRAISPIRKVRASASTIKRKSAIAITNTATAPMTPPVVPSSKATSAPNTVPILYKPSSSPVRASLRAQSKKRRRINYIFSDSENGGDDDVAWRSGDESDPLGGGERYEQDTSSSPVPQAPSSARHAAHLSSSSAKMPRSLHMYPNTTVTPTSTKAKRRETAVASTSSASRSRVGSRVKKERFSPDEQHLVGGPLSDDDPLAMV